MAALAVAALAATWLVQQWPLAPIPAWVALAAPLAVFATGWLAGWRAAFVVLLAGCTLLRAQWIVNERWPESLAGTDVVVIGTICEFPRRDADAFRFVLQVQPDPPLPARLHLSWYEPESGLRPGERWQLQVRLKPPRGLSNPGAFDFEQWLYRRGIGATGYVRPSSLNRRLAEDPAICPTARLRAGLAGRIGTMLQGQRAAPYVVGIAVGATHGLQAADWELLRRTGTTHLMAISGLNIAMVALPFLWLGRVAVRLWPGLGIRIPAGVGLLPGLVAAAGYSALAGFEVSTLRACLMLLLAALLVQRGQRVAAIDLLAAAAVLIVALDPFAVLTASFWLSFAGVAWLILAAAGMRLPQTDATGAERAPCWHGPALHALTFSRVQLVLGLGLAPLSIAWFAQVSAIAPLTNLIAVPVFSVLVMPLTLAGTALLPIGGGELPLRLAAEVLALLLSGLERVALWPVALWQPPPVTGVGLGLATASVVLLCWPRPMPLRWVAGLGLLPLLFGIRQASPDGLMRVVALDVGQGLAVLVQTSHHALLYDTGPAFRSRDAGSSVVIPALRALGVRQLDVLLVSHDDADHKGGATAVLQAFPGALLVATARHGLQSGAFQRCDTGHGWSWDGAQFRLIGPDATRVRPTSDNDASCVLEVRHAGGSLLLPGDISERRERELVDRGLVASADVVLAPHHGSRSSSGAAFVRETGARLAVMSAGYRNRWGFPAAEVVQRWTGQGACVLSTADTGALTLAFSAVEGLVIERRQRVDGARLWTLPPIGSTACDGIAARQ
jgi:competence protein ComEC